MPPRRTRSTSPPSTRQPGRPSAGAGPTGGGEEVAGRHARRRGGGVAVPDREIGRVGGVLGGRPRGLRRPGGGRRGDAHVVRRVAEAEGRAGPGGVGRAGVGEVLGEAARAGEEVGARVVGVGVLGNHHGAGDRGPGHRRVAGGGGRPGGEEEGDERGAEDGESERRPSPGAHGVGAASAPRRHSPTIAVWVVKASGGRSSTAKRRTSSTSGHFRGVPETIRPA